MSLEFVARSRVQHLMERDRKKAEARAAAIAAGQEEPPKRPKRPRGMTLDKVLTRFGGPKQPKQQHRRRISKEDISKPIPHNSIHFPAPLTPLTPSSGPTPLPTPVDSVSRSSSVAAPNTPTTQATPSRLGHPSARSQSLEECYIPSTEQPAHLRKFLSDPTHSHRYPELQGSSHIVAQSVPNRGNRRRLHRVQTAPSSTGYTPPPTPLDQSDHCSNGTHPTAFSSPPPPPYPPPPPPSIFVQRTEPPGQWDTASEDTVVGGFKPNLSPSPLFTESEVNLKRLSRILESPLEPSFEAAQQSTQRLVATMEPGLSRASLQPPASVGTKGRAIQQAKEMELLVAERAKRSGDDLPPYDFFELIGKGAYGRVFKGKNRATGGLVAIKIIDIDKVDYEEMTTKNLQETLKEINILQQLKDSRARPYVNIIEEARTVHNELWIISEYASGGSVNTLLKPTMSLSKKGLEEKYIIPIARELALGLKYIHEAGVIHRDLKCNNILILEDGRVQLCDFGVSGALEPEIAKRSTIVGTPFWMAPELQKEWVKEADPSSRIRPNEILYGSEVDIWAYGCTIYEMATGFPPFHMTKLFSLPDAGVPILEGEQFSDELKDLISFVCQPNVRDRPVPDEILEHPYLKDSTKMYPTVTLVALVERYYKWEYAGGSRVSLFNPYGAQAPDPLAPEPEDDEDEDWTFSTTDEFEKQFAGELPTDPFVSSISTEGFQGIDAPPVTEDRFAKLQATIMNQQADRGKKRLDRLFDPNSTPYRFSTIDPDPGRPPSDLILRDFNPGAPNRETVIDLDFAAPTVADIPSIDLGEVPTVKANRLNKLMRDMDMEEEEEERDSFDMDQTARRATRDWKFPAMPEQPNRRTVDWKFPAMPEKTNRRTMEWTFDFSMAEADQEPLPKLSRLSRRRDTQELSLPLATTPPEENRQTRDFVFPMRDPAEGGSLSDQGFEFSSSPTLEPGFRSSLGHATTEQLGSYEDYPRVISAPDSPLRTSMIDLDMANIDDFRPSTADSASTSTYTAGTENMNGNPFDLEDQVHLSTTNNRASYHMKSQSEPNHAIPGLLTPQTYDEQGYPTNQDPHHPSMHARGVSSVSQMQAKPPPSNIGYVRQRAQQQQQPPLWDGWSHQDAFRIDESPPTSVSPSTSAEESDSIDSRWDKLERQTSQSSNRRQFSSKFRSRRTASQDEDPRSDAEDNYASESYDEMPARLSRVSVGPNGRPLVDFPIPRGPDPEALLGVEADPTVLANALWKSTVELRDGLRTSRDLLKSMRLAEMPMPQPVVEEEEEEEK